MDEALIYRYNQKLIDNLNDKVIPALKEPKSQLESLGKDIQDCFTIDGLGVCKNTFDTTKNNINAIISKINGSVIPELQSKVNGINSDIKYYQYLIKKEQNKNSEGEE